MSDEEKNLKEFLGFLLEITQQNIDFSEGKRPKKLPDLYLKYKKEIEKVQDTINSFDFVIEKIIEHDQIKRLLIKNRGE